MSANVTGGVGLHAADLLTTLKTGWLLGAKPRHQVYAQLLGVLAGAAIIVPRSTRSSPTRRSSAATRGPRRRAWCGPGVSKDRVERPRRAVEPRPRPAMVVGLALGVVMAMHREAGAAAGAHVPAVAGRRRHRDGHPRAPTRSRCSSARRSPS
jgi:hypothetical protein